MREETLGDIDQIRVTASRSDDEPHRLIRLYRVVGYIYALSEHIGYDVVSRISKLHDHKGILEVEWRGQPSEAEKSMVTKAWASGIGDGSNNVEHTVQGSK